MYNSGRAWSAGWTRIAKDGSWGGLPAHIEWNVPQAASALWRTHTSPSMVAHRCLRGVGIMAVGGQEREDWSTDLGLDWALLEFLVCPLSKMPFRYEASTNELK